MEDNYLPARITFLLDADISSLTLGDKAFCEESAALFRRDNIFWEVVIYIGTDDDREYLDSHL